MADMAEIRIDVSELDELRRLRGELDATSARLDNQAAGLRSVAEEVSSRLTMIVSRANRAAHLLERILRSEAFREAAGITSEQQADLLRDLEPVTGALRGGIRGAILGRTVGGPLGAVAGAVGGAAVGGLADPERTRQAAGWVDALAGKLWDDLERLERQRQTMRRARRGADE